ncbi:MAG TPA: cyclic nucleotide-binding domain-containing protein [Rhodocyclaceae bacterium]|jgi:CRP-like cAMP-binding protein|nr:cyclic nucleotide-binding domain-containing protein [Rhodocyclaceae bacterium]
MSRNMADLLDGLDLFTGFSYPELQHIGRFVGYQGVKRGDVVFREGDPGSFMLILVEGQLSIYKGGEHGQRLLSYEGKGRVVGEMALLDHERRSATCIVDADSLFVTLDHAGLDAMAEAYPGLAYLFMLSLARLLSKRLRRTSGLLVEHLAA